MSIESFGKEMHRTGIAWRKMLARKYRAVAELLSIYPQALELYRDIEERAMDLEEQAAGLEAELREMELEASDD